MADKVTAPVVVVQDGRRYVLTSSGVRTLTASAWLAARTRADIAEASRR